MLVREDQLDEFVSQVDALGGPGNPATEAYWQGFQYVPSAPLDPTLEPDGPDYAAAMMRIYEELAGRRFEPRLTELTQVDVARLVPLESPYGMASSSHRVMHYLRLSTACHLGRVNGGRALDMGCGWGLSSEFLAQLGHEVTAVDINPSFVELVNSRARRLALKIQAIQSGFEEFRGEEGSFDVALFYECLHHAADVRIVLRNVAALLKPGGVLLLAGEPIQSLWWPHWGLRLDPLSVYCIRKFGWFESGWSSAFLCRALADAGLVPVLHQNLDPIIGPLVVAHKTQTMDASLLRTAAEDSDWWFEPTQLVSNRNGRTSRLRLPGGPPDRITLKLNNFGVAPLDVDIDAHGAKHRQRLAPGPNLLSMAPGLARGFTWNLSFSCDAWSPQDVLGNGDTRKPGFHLERLDLF